MESPMACSRTTERRPSAAMTTSLSTTVPSARCVYAVSSVSSTEATVRPVSRVTPASYARSPGSSKAAAR
ncbi:MULTISPECIES: hypothetical protein [Nocardiopsis]|nr:MULTISPECIES: hypothetical protein [Nocardiopsis]